ncbi:hypothetical protein C2E25_13255 [Geothermobacter hydrogeniphilus]|uniref:Deoxynucleotide monophosphate kinase n=1 Tax=Geothermobacter hydrogeniphilus TaxID=1969733 RepID=A0A2K2H7L7_9BACT|nr:hypothetical protein [Geothermobacter hydrogeniphilus]PNU19305.1 hypothetical protein C2E25_13255 [Geothermobacter hydrogeniphilus]
MILGFAGKAASGKTTAAHHLAPLLQRETLIVPMAMLLRDEVEGFLRQVGAVDHVPLVYGSQEDKVRTFYIDQEKALEVCPPWADFIRINSAIQDRPGQTALTVRLILQWWGTEYRRAREPDYWTRAWTRKVRDYDLDRVHILVDDVRFMNELRSIRELDGRIIKIERPGYAAAGNHASETSLDGFDAWDDIILNDGSLELFKSRVAELPRVLSIDS